MKFSMNCFDFLLGVNANVGWALGLVFTAIIAIGGGIGIRSEERRVGKEC